jgi:3',5'-cyclic-AMP phosphodiesterase
MPLHLTPHSRREFLRRSLLASAGLLTIPALRAAATGADPHRFALLSDTHIAADPTTIMREVHLVDHLRAVVDEVGKLTAPPAGLFINGDCALTRGLAGDYATLTETLKPIAAAGVPMHMTMGNHDDREVFWTALNGAKAVPAAVASKHVSVVESPRANWFLLDSLDVVNQTPGVLGEEQRGWLAKALDARAEKPALVMLHHNPNNPADVKKTGLGDTAELLALLLPRKHVKAVFFGHTHVWRQFEQDGLHMINLPPVAYVFKPEIPSGWVDCQLREGGAALTLRAHDAEHPAHGKSLELNWRT